MSKKNLLESNQISSQPGQFRPRMTLGGISSFSVMDSAGKLVSGSSSPARMLPIFYPPQQPFQIPISINDENEKGQSVAWKQEKEVKAG